MILIYRRSDWHPVTKEERHLIDIHDVSVRSTIQENLEVVQALVMLTSR